MLKGTAINIHMHTSQIQEFLKSDHAHLNVYAIFFFADPVENKLQTS